jgi:ABC-type molybdate transport system substrate-binding protein
MEIIMSNKVESLIRQAAPRVTQEPELFLAALNVSDEAARSLQAAAGKRRRVRWAVGVAAAVALGGTTAAAAATQTLWWSAPNEVTAELTPATDVVTPVTTVSYILSADFAPDTDPDSTEAKEAFQLAQQWLAGRPVVTVIPADARTLTADEAQGYIDQGWPAQTALEQKAIQATQVARDAAIESGLNALSSDLRAYLTECGVDPALIVIDAQSGVFEVGQ